MPDAVRAEAELRHARAAVGERPRVIVKAHAAPKGPLLLERLGRPGKGRPLIDRDGAAHDLRIGLRQRGLGDVKGLEPLAIEGERPERWNMGRVSFQSIGMRSASSSPLAQASRIFARMAATGAGRAARSREGAETIPDFGSAWVGMASSLLAPARPSNRPSMR